MPLVLHLPCNMHFADPLPTLAFFLETAAKPKLLDHFWQGAESIALATTHDAWMSIACPTLWCFQLLIFQNASAASYLSTAQLRKSAPTLRPFYLFKRPWRHSTTRLFNNLISKTVLAMVCLARFDFKTCFALQRRAIFQQISFQKVLERYAVFSLFDFDIRRSSAQFFDLLSRQMSPHSSPLNPPWPQNIVKTERLAAFLRYPAFWSSFYWFYTSSLILFLLFLILLPLSLLWMFP